MTKKALLKEYLKSRVDFKGLYNDWAGSWLINKPKSWLYCNGIVSEYFTYSLMCEAIKYANYAHPKSNKTWSTAGTVTRELIDEHVFN